METSLSSSTSSWGEVERKVLMSSLLWPVIELVKMAWSWVKVRFRLDIRKRLFTQRVLGHWNSLLREALQHQTWQNSRTFWTMVSGTWCYSWGDLWRARSRTQWSWWTPSNTTYCMILWKLSLHTQAQIQNISKSLDWHRNANKNHIRCIIKAEKADTAPPPHHSPQLWHCLSRTFVPQIFYSSSSSLECCRTSTQLMFNSQAFI